MIPLGVYTLQHPIGRGGMAHVWLGHHRDLGTPVAVKVMAERRARDARFRRAFHNEARASAGLDHPNIVEVYDTGEIPPESAAQSDGRLFASSPYLVMEYVDAGTLGMRRERLAWRELRAVLQSLLDALAHAHARQVIHRDLKPGNVLFGAGGAHVKLTDFGLAHAVNREGVTSENARDSMGGTPGYMAPEQFMGISRDIGPWSDLYALGCLVFTMVQGEPPFGRKPWLDVANGHCYEPPPPLTPHTAVPDGFTAWVERLVAKEVPHRYQRAADAAWDLARLDDPDADIATADASSGEPPPTATPTTLLWHARLVREATPTHPAPDDPTVEIRRPPPLPFSWRRRERARPRGMLGPGLLSRRSLPLVGRDDEREALWGALRRTRRHGRAGVVVLEGTAGCGKTRLAEWLCQRAHELGAATILRASHHPVGTRADGLGPMLLSHVRCAGLIREEVILRSDAFFVGLGLDADEIEALQEIVAPATREERQSGTRSLRFRSPTERHAALRTLLHREAFRRPLVVRLHDVQWGLDALEFALGLLDAQEERASPVLLLLSVRVDALDPASPEAALLELLLEDRWSDRLTVRALSPPDAENLLRDAVGLAPQLARQVVERTTGNPDFALRLVSDWAERGALVDDPDGYRLREGTDLALPDDMHDLWSRTLSGFFAPRPEGDRIALELAAVLGREVEQREWALACFRAEVRPTDDLVDDLIGWRLATKTEPGAARWSLAHGMLRESLLRHCDEAGRLRGHHAICAALVADAPGEEERLAHHRLGAGEDEAALAPLLVAAAERVDRLERHAAELLLDTWEQTLDRLDPERERPRAAGWTLRTRLARRSGRLTDAEAWAVRAEADAREAGQRASLQTVLRERARLALRRGDPADAEARIREALQLSAGPDGRAPLTCDLGLVQLARRDLQQADRTLRQATALYVEAGRPEGAVHAWMGLAEVARRTGHLEDAATWAEKARHGAEAGGDRAGMARALVAQAACRRQQGDLDRADAQARAAARWYGLIGRARHPAPRLEEVLILLAKGRTDRAEGLLTGLIEEGLDGRLRAIAHACQAVCQAWRRTWPDFDRALEACAAAGHADDPDRVAQLSHAAELAARGGDPGRAERARGLLPT